MTLFTLSNKIGKGKQTRKEAGIIVYLNFISLLLVLFKYDKIISFSFHKTLGSLNLISVPPYRIRAST